MSNIVNLAKIFEIANPETIKTVINKIQNSADANGKTFEEVLQQVFSQLNDEKLKEISEDNSNAINPSQAIEKQKGKNSTLQASYADKNSQNQQVSEKPVNIDKERPTDIKDTEQNLVMENSESTETSEINQKDFENDNSQLIRLNVKDEKSGITQQLQRFFAQKIYTTDPIDQKPNTDTGENKKMDYVTNFENTPEYLSNKQKTLPTKEPLQSLKSMVGELKDRTHTNSGETVDLENIYFELPKITEYQTGKDAKVDNQKDTTQLSNQANNPQSLNFGNQQNYISYSENMFNAIPSNMHSHSLYTKESDNRISEDVLHSYNEIVNLIKEMENHTKSSAPKNSSAPEDTRTYVQIHPHNAEMKASKDEIISVSIDKLKEKLPVALESPTFINSQSQGKDDARYKNNIGDTNNSLMETNSEQTFKLVGDASKEFGKTSYGSYNSLDQDLQKLKQIVISFNYIAIIQNNIDNLDTVKPNLVNYSNAEKSNKTKAHDNTIKLIPQITSENIQNTYKPQETSKKLTGNLTTSNQQNNENGSIINNKLQGDIKKTNGNLTIFNQQNNENNSIANRKPQEIYRKTNENAAIFKQENNENNLTISNRLQEVQRKTDEDLSGLDVEPKSYNKIQQVDNNHRYFVHSDTVEMEKIHSVNSEKRMQEDIEVSPLVLVNQAGQQAFSLKYNTSEVERKNDKFSSTDVVNPEITDVKKNAEKPKVDETSESKTLNTNENIAEDLKEITRASVTNLEDRRIGEQRQQNESQIADNQSASQTKQTNESNKSDQRGQQTKQSQYNDTNNQDSLRKSASDSTKNNIEIKSFHVEYKEKSENNEKENTLNGEKPKVSNKFVERLAELTYKFSEQKLETVSNVLNGKYELAERLQASRNLEEIYEKIREFGLSNRLEERIQMKLVPQNLGNLDVEMKKEGRQLTVLFVAENERAKEIIEKNIYVLREKLSSLDFDVRNIEIRLKEEERYYDHEKNHQQSNQNNQDENRRRYMKTEVNEDDDEREYDI
ncbi:MAG: flagellar hook-length control protein FliK [Fervidobacterium sp.]|nr:flagellar hook-length control protein FliK [Fervidobacterium sp.]